MVDASNISGPDVFTERKQRMNPFAAVAFGILLVIASLIAMGWNEWRSVERIRTLDEGKKITVSVSADYTDMRNDDMLVHLQGQAKVVNGARDPMFQVHPR